MELPGFGHFFNNGIKSVIDRNVWNDSNQNFGLPSGNVVCKLTIREANSLLGFSKSGTSQNNEGFSDKESNLTPTESLDDAKKLYSQVLSTGLSTESEVTTQNLTENPSLPLLANSKKNLNRYKTELCRQFQELRWCQYSEKCQFAHGIHELRSVVRHPKYKTELCITFHSNGFCPYGPRCHFIHSLNEARMSNEALQVLLKTSKVKYQSFLMTKTTAVQPINGTQLSIVKPPQNHSFLDRAIYKNLKLNSTSTECSGASSTSSLSPSLTGDQDELQDRLPIHGWHPH